MPHSSSDKSFNNTKSWVDNALAINGSIHNGPFESVCLKPYLPLLSRFILCGNGEARNGRSKAIVNSGVCCNVEGTEDNWEKEKQLSSYLKQYLGK